MPFSSHVLGLGDVDWRRAYKDLFNTNVLDHKSYVGIFSLGDFLE